MPKELKNITIAMSQEDIDRLNSLKKALRTHNSCYAIRWLLAEANEKILPAIVTKELNSVTQ